ncbi:MAG TPA: RcnB family protein [Rhizomicrobium sp.]|nr:RcnB family protein [Rhizomicrobium sp.]
MKGFLIAALLAGLSAALPGSACAQPHPSGSHPAAVHPMPAMHVPSAHFHAVTHRPVFHHYAHRTATHHVYHHHHHVIIHRHVVHQVRHATHVNAAVARLRRNVTATRRFHAGIYHAPPGYHYRRWGYGQFLPAIYWGRDFWITDFLAFGLFAPPPGYIWVRYGPDALLIDEYTGEIIQVDYGVFY